MDRYAREVALHIARNRPKGPGAKGKVTVEFVLSARDGKVETLKILRTSGTAKLDALAVSAIEAARFPLPPNGMSRAQLTYRLPFVFE